MRMSFCFGFLVVFFNLFWSSWLVVAAFKIQPPNRFRIRLLLKVDMKSSKLPYKKAFFFQNIIIVFEITFYFATAHTEWIRYFMNVF